MTKQDAIRKYTEYEKKNMLESIAVHEAGHMFIAKRLFPERDWEYIVDGHGKPMVECNNGSGGLFEMHSPEELLPVLMYNVAGLVSEANWIGLGDNAADIIEFDCGRFNGKSDSDEQNIELILKTYMTWTGKELSLRKVVSEVLAMFRQNKKEYMAEVHASKRFYSQFKACRVAFDKVVA